MQIEMFQRVILKEAIVLNIKIDENGCWIWQGSKSGGTGYGHFNRFKRTWSAHRVAYRIWKGTIPDGLCVLHRCDVRACCNPDHLFVGTHADNVADKVRKGRQSAGKGEGHGKAKLTARKVRVIRARVKDGAVHSKLAKRYGVDKSTISHAAVGRTWR